MTDNDLAAITVALKQTLENLAAVVKRLKAAEARLTHLENQVANLIRQANP